MIRADTNIGGYAVRADGTLAGALRQFGRPTSIRRGRAYDATSCYVAWRPLGLRMTFSKRGRGNPCDPRSGEFAHALMTGARWRTAKGLRIGDPRRRLRTLYGQRRLAGAWSWLVVRYNPIATVHYGLEARSSRGRVVAFRVTYVAGPD